MPDKTLTERVVDAAEAVLARQPSVSALEMLMALRWLEYVHVQGWQSGNPHCTPLESLMQSKRPRRVAALKDFERWGATHKLERFQTRYFPRARTTEAELRIAEDGAPAIEELYRVSFMRPDLSAKRQETVRAKAEQAPELAVFEAFHAQSCSECGEVVGKGQLVFVEKGNPVCLSCADLDHLVLLPSGDQALTRRAKKYSQLWAAVLKFNRRLRRQVRTGLLITPEALAKAEAECVADADVRAARRAVEEERRRVADREYIGQVTAEIIRLFPGCPPKTAAAVADHACQRGSGRVGRSAAAKALAPDALRLAVAAHARHVHTNYDELLLTGCDRERAREIVRPRVGAIMDKWRQTAE